MTTRSHLLSVAFLAIAAHCSADFQVPNVDILNFTEPTHLRLTLDISVNPGTETTEPSGFANLSINKLPQAALVTKNINESLSPKLTIIGSGSCMPLPHRRAPGNLVSSNDVHVLVDSGPGTLQAVSAMGTEPEQLHGVFTPTSTVTTSVTVLTSSRGSMF